MTLSWPIFFCCLNFFCRVCPSGISSEFGSYKGGSAIFMAALAQKFLPGVQVIGFDAFIGMPASDRVVDAHRPGGFADIGLPELRRYVECINLRSPSFVQGYFDETAGAALQ